MRSWGDSFSSAFLGAYQMATQQAEQRKREEADKQLGQLYFDMASKDAYSNVQPHEGMANVAEDDAYRKQMIKEASAMTDANIANNPHFAQKLQVKTPVATSENPAPTVNASVTPDIQQQWQTNNQANLDKANANAMSAEQTLQLAKEKYGTDMFDKMQPYIGKIPSDKLIGIVNNMQVKAQQQADKLALNSAMAVFGRKDASDDEKKQAAVAIATLKPELGKMFQNFFAPKDDSFTLSPGQVRYVNGNPIANVPKDNSLTPYQAERLRLQALGLQDKEPKKLEWEKEHHDYEKTHGMNDAQLVQEYWAMSQDPAQSALITPEKQAKYNVASARVNKYLAQPNLTKDEQDFLSSLDRSKLTQEQGFKMLQQYRMNKLNGIRQ